MTDEKMLELAQRAGFARDSFANADCACEECNWALEPLRKFAALTAREYAAIQLRVPDSGTPWLDEMIRASLRRDFSKPALSAHIRCMTSADVGGPESWNRMISEMCALSADALLAESEKQP